MHLTARIVDNLHHDLILGMTWLSQVNPVIDWVSYNVQLSDTVKPVHCIPTAPVAHVTSCSLASAEYSIQHGAVAWLALLKDGVDMESSPPLNGEDARPSDRWEALCSEYSQVFDEPGEPQPRSI